ncbi:MAG TPA: ABC transporter substrate-binding protein [Gaiellaceae bacterium]|jgi:branched-chain amino acid transport system substrate-binding protein
MKRWSSRVGLVLGVAAIGVACFVASASARTTAKKPIVIGWAFDSKGSMAPFDNPALAAAKIRVKQVNARGGVNGRPIKIETCDTQGNKPTIAKACALKLLGQGADVMFTTCDVDLGAPVIQEAINRGVLAVAPCIGTDQMGPKRFGAKGKLAFSYGNVAQDEGSAMAQYAWSKGWRSAALATDTVIVYFKNVIQAFKARWQQLGGKVVDEETYQSLGGNNVQNVVSRVNGVKADVVVTATAGAFGALSTLVSGLRSLGNNTPILNSWAGDGTYWLPKSPQVTNYYFVTFASVFGDDPSSAVNKLAKQVHAATGGFITGPAAVDGVITAIKRAHGSTKGSALAAQMEKFHKVPTLSGLVSFSPRLHTVFGRQYRVIEINDNKARRVGLVTAKVVPRI